MGRSRLSRLGLPLLTLLSIGLWATPAQAARVLFVSDASADDAIPAVLAADGHQVVTVMGDFATGNATLASGDLGGFGLVVWSASGNGYGDVHGDPEVFAHLSDYVREGGRVLVTGYDSVASPGDPLLIAFLGATGSTDVPSAPGPMSLEATSLTSGQVDLRGVAPIPTSGDRDTLTGLMSDTLEIVGTSGGGGAQWTLRRLGRGEIAYVSNGDPLGSSASWAIASSDGSGAYNAALRNFARAAAGWAASVTPSARVAGSPRRARTLALTDASCAAVLLGPTRAWIPPGVAPPIAVCGPSCHPVVQTRACAVPECPGAGTLLVTSERIADVSDFPRDREGWNRERMSLIADPEMTPIAWAFGTHPEPPPAPPSALRFVPRSHHWVGFELHIEGALGGLIDAGTPIGTVSASLGPRFMPHDIGEPLDVMYGNVHGVEARATLVMGLDGQRPDDLLLLVGLSPTFGYAFPDERIRIPSAFALLLPELGVAVSTTHPLTYYFAWHLEGALLVDEHVGVDLRADLVLLADRVAGHDMETMLTLGAGVFFR